MRFTRPSLGPAPRPVKTTARHAVNLTRVAGGMVSPKGDPVPTGSGRLALYLDPKTERITGNAEADALTRRTYRAGHWAVPKGGMSLRAEGM